MSVFDYIFGRDIMAWLKPGEGSLKWPDWPQDIRKLDDEFTRAMRRQFEREFGDPDQIGSYKNSDSEDEEEVEITPEELAEERNRLIIAVIIITLASVIIFHLPEEFPGTKKKKDNSGDDSGDEGGNDPRGDTRGNDPRGDTRGNDPRGDTRADDPRGDRKASDALRKVLRRRGINI